MTNWGKHFKGKRITVMGLGLLGRTAGDIEFIAQQGAKHITVTDIRSAKILAPSVKRLKKYKNIHFVLGRHRLEDFRNIDFVLKAPSIPLASLYVKEAERRGIPVYMSTALFAKFATAKGAQIVGITGTRGKSTVAHLLFHILKTSKRKAHLGLTSRKGVGPRATDALGPARKTLRRKVFLGGNIRGISTLAMLPRIHKGDIVVMELDSWQLQGFHTLRISPSIAVITSFMEDHLNYYPSMKRYFKDKAAIFAHQKKGDVLIVGSSAQAWLSKKLLRPVLAVSAKDFPNGWNFALPGDHNRENAACALAAARALRISERDIRKGTERFVGVEGRLQKIREVRGLSIWNDNNATTPSATVAALKALRGMGRVILVMGGSDKGLSLRELAREAKQAEVVLLPGTGTNAFKKAFKGSYISVYSLKDAVRQAMRIAEKGDRILFSPAFASFGLFKNEYDRNDQFVKLVRTL